MARHDRARRRRARLRLDEVDLLRDDERVDEKLRDRRADHLRIREVDDAHRTLPNEIEGGRFVATELESIELGMRRDPNHGCADPTKGSVDVLPCGGGPDASPHRRQRIERRGRTAVALQDVDGVVVVEHRLRRQDEELFELAFELRAHAELDARRVAETELDEDLPLEPRALLQLLERSIELFLGDEPELQHHLAEVIVRLERPNLRGRAADEEDGRDGLVLETQLERARKSALHRVDEQMRERRLGERPLRRRFQASLTQLSKCTRERVGDEP